MLLAYLFKAAYLSLPHLQRADAAPCVTRSEGNKRSEEEQQDGKGHSCCCSSLESYDLQCTYGRLYTSSAAQKLSHLISTRASP